MDLGSLFQKVSGVLDGQTRQNDSVDTDGLIGQVADLFRGHATENGAAFPDQNYQGGSGNVLPASQDPMGDPADQQQSGVLPASQDPLGDPADRR